MSPAQALKQDLAIAEKRRTSQTMRRSFQKSISRRHHRMSSLSYSSHLRDHDLAKSLPSRSSHGRGGKVAKQTVPFFRGAFGVSGRRQKLSTKVVKVAKSLKPNVATDSPAFLGPSEIDCNLAQFH